MKYPAIKNYIGEELIDGRNRHLDVHAPSDGSILSRVTLSASEDIDKAVEVAKEAFPSWANTPIKERAQIFFNYKRLLEKNMDELVNLVVEENGKTREEAEAEVLKSAELTEFACSMPQLISGDILEVSKGVECREEYFPLGVVASITPFNFPNMVPNWTIPNALVLGNTMVLKPSEQVPISANRIAELLKEAGLPKGVFNVVHGDREAVEAICDHPGIEAVSFVGSTRVAKIVYKRATSNLKRVLALGGAKNHLIVLPDAHVSMTANNVAVSMTGCAGQRCMAASVMVAVGDVDHIIEELCSEARKIVPGKNLGSIISAKAKERIENYITEAENEGAKILVDGRNYKVEGLENGFYVGPTIVDHVRPDMKIGREEVFGPVLSIIRVENLDQAIALENSSHYGNAAAIYTQSGGFADYTTKRVDAGMIGVNIGVPVPREPFSFGGWNDSRFGVGDLTGKSSIAFWTKLKKITTKWNPESRVNWMS
jgi:malonate-semialdehyde dehydrogenase (acetylating)/methylmalonate-semialdehyde dehydrogenase